MKEISGLENVSFDSAVTYTILEEIGRGGMGIVYLAERSCMGVSDLVVLKSIRSISSAEEEQLRKEANIATRLRHENIVKTYGLEALPWSALPQGLAEEPDEGRPRPDLERRRGSPRRGGRRAVQRGQARHRLRSVSIQVPRGEERKLLLIVMDYIDGLDLHSLFQEHLKAGFLIPPMLGAFIVSRICRALAYAHEMIVHRDISPDNVMINRHGVCKLSDFGIAVAADDATRQIAGKTTYMAPEVYSRGPVDERIDVFSLGVVFYQVLTGIQPLWTDHSQSFAVQKDEVLRQLAAGIPAPHEVRADIPEEISRIVARMIEPDPDRRYSRMGVIGDEIERNYLYARGFGPTNNSLAAYVRLFQGGFGDAGADELGQLSFLRDEEGRIAIQRPLRLADYTRKGLEMVKARKGSPIFKKLAQQQKDEQRQRQDRRAGRPAVTFKYGDNLLETYLLEDGEVTIGRDPANRCALSDPGASRRHARIRLDAGRAVVEDLGSNNGTLVNGKRIERAELAEGDRIQIGGSVAYYRLEPEPPAPGAVLTVDPARPLDPATLEGNDLEFRYASDPAASAEVGRLVADLAAEIERHEGQLEALGEACRDTLVLLADPPGRQLSVRFMVRSSRISVTVRGPAGDDAVGALFARLERHAANASTAEDPRLRSILRGAERIEHLTHLGGLRLSKAL